MRNFHVFCPLVVSPFSGNCAIMVRWVHAGTLKKYTGCRVGWARASKIPVVGRYLKGSMPNGILEGSGDLASRPYVGLIDAPVSGQSVHNPVYNLATKYTECKP